MILVDTSIWIDHPHQSEQLLVQLLDRAQVCAHAMIIGELALGSIRQRPMVLSLLAALPSVVAATDSEVMELVERHRLFGRGLSLVDAHLLATARLDPEVQLWTRDPRLRDAAADLGVAGDPED